MNLATFPELVVEGPVDEFLKQHGAEETFQTVYQLARECFPEYRGFQVDLRDDPDEPNCARAVLHVILPRSHSLDLLQSQRRRFSEELVNRVPPTSGFPLVGLTIDFAGE
jgi:hypothetical protein